MFRSHNYFIFKLFNRIILICNHQVIENSGYGADKFTMVRNNDGTGSLKIVQSLDYEDILQSNGFRFKIQVNDKVHRHSPF